MQENTKFLNEYWNKSTWTPEPNVTMDDGGDMDVVDCASDGSCPEEGGDYDTEPKEAATLMEETQNALQQFSIGQ